jgi:hypothetical protein
MKREIFRNAWETERNAQKQSGGSVKSYFAEALRQAWGTFKTEKNMEHTIIYKNDVYNERRYSRPWIATISVEGMKPQYSFDGQFLGEHGLSGETMMKTETGKIIAIGQKDYRGSHSLNRWFKVVGSFEKIEIVEGYWDDCDGLQEISKSDATKYLMGV